MDDFAVGARLRRRRDDIRQRSAVESRKCPLCDDSVKVGYYCRKCNARRARHGSLYARSFRAAELRPYIAAARKWIDEHQSDPLVDVTLNSVESAMLSAGRTLEGSSTRGLSPEATARDVVARLRDGDVPPRHLAAAFIGVAALIADRRAAAARGKGLDVPHSPEFRRVQAAKVLHRMAGGFHKRWQVPTREGEVVMRVDRYGRSAGRVLRHLGAWLARHCDALAEHCVGDVIAFVRSAAR